MISLFFILNDNKFGKLKNCFFLTIEECENDLRIQSER
jgi:hypothetical protein